MADSVKELETERLRLRHWRQSDREPFAAMNADSEVMADLGGPLHRNDSDRKLEHYLAAFDRHGFTRWVVEDLDGQFLGYTGIMARNGDHPLGVHREIGWRFTRQAWGHGYATEAAKAVLHDAFTRLHMDEVLAYTAPDNFRSQAVMERLGLQRDATRDFVIGLDHNPKWHGLVWVARPARV